MEQQVQSQNQYFIPNVALTAAKDKQSLQMNVDRAKMQAQATDSAAAHAMRAEQAVRDNELRFAQAQMAGMPQEVPTGLGAL